MSIPVAGQAQQITVTIDVVEDGFPNAQVEDIVLWLRNKGNHGETARAERERTRDRTLFRSVLSQHFLNRTVVVEMRSDVHRMVGDVELHLDTLREYQTTVVVERKRKAAFDRSEKAKLHLASLAPADRADAAKIEPALRLYDEAIKIHPAAGYIKDRTYTALKIVVPGKIADETTASEMINRYVVNLPQEKIFQDLPTTTRKVIMLESTMKLSDAIQANEGELPELSKMAARVAESAIELAPDNFRPYQLKAQVLRNADDHEAAIEVVASYLEKHRDLKAEQIIKVFLAEWATNLESLTAFLRDIPERKYVDDMRKNPQFLAQWRRFHASLAHFRGYFAKGESADSARFREHLRRAKLILDPA
ncbi:MAG: hypothetical protein FJX47_12940 [Alphaproteobacteria bacterium]|nr:hypothetical protein [Alphaproteobacteria bacterium]